MKDLLEKILQYLPMYFIDFGQLFSGPKTFLQSKRAEPNAFNNALIFISICLLLSNLMNYPLRPNNSDMLAQTMASGVLWLIAISLGAAVLMICWRVAGGRAEPQAFFVVYLYQFGLVAVLSSAVQLAAFGFVKTVDRDRYGAFVATIRTGRDLTGVVNRSAAMGAIVILLSGIALCCVWQVIAWGAFRDLFGAGRGRSAFVALLALLLSIPVLAIVVFVGSALDVDK